MIKEAPEPHTTPFGNEKKILKSKSEGHVIGFNNCPVVHKGDALLHIATQKKNLD